MRLRRLSAQPHKKCLLSDVRLFHRPWDDQIAKGFMQKKEKDMSAIQITPGETGEPRGGVIAYLQVEGTTKAAAFYEKAFGAKEVARHPVDEQGRTMHLHLYINGGSVMMSDPYPEYGHAYIKPAGITLTLCVDDVDFWWDRASKAEGMEVVMPLEKMFWGDRFGQLRDPFGYDWAIVGK